MQPHQAYNKNAENTDRHDAFRQQPVPPQGCKIVLDEITSDMPSAMLASNIPHGRHPARASSSCCPAAMPAFVPPAGRKTAHTLGIRASIRQFPSHSFDLPGRIQLRQNRRQETRAVEVLPWPPSARSVRGDLGERVGYSPTLVSRSLQAHRTSDIPSPVRNAPALQRADRRRPTLVSCDMKSIRVWRWPQPRHHDPLETARRRP